MKKKKYTEFDENVEFYDDDDEITIDWVGIARKLLARKKLFGVTFIVTLAVAIPLVLTIPKYYTVEVKLSPETSTSSGISGGALSGLMNTFGIGSSSSGEDAIYPQLYPDLMNSKTFLVSLFDIPVKSKDGKINTTYAEYLAKDQKAPIWSEAMKSIFDLFGEKETEIKESAPNAAALTKKQEAVAKAIAANVTCDIDKKTEVITISVKDQDPVICAAVADSTCQRLQEFITEYRSKKTKKEMLDVEKQYNQAQAAYEVAKQRVEGYNDSHWDLSDKACLVAQQDLQNKMSLAFQTMTAFNTQLLAARSKYQSSLPVFTVLDGASVPLKPAGPKRSLFLIGIIFLVLASEMAYILFKDKAKDAFTSIKETPKF